MLHKLITHTRAFRHGQKVNSFIENVDEHGSLVKTQEIITSYFINTLPDTCEETVARELSIN